LRINRYLAQSGLASRRKAEEYIIAGRVKVNNKVITDLSYDVGERDNVMVEGKLYKPSAKKIYIMLNKPKGYITTTDDEKGRKTVMDLIDEKIKKHGIYPIGRLDYATEGLLLLTNDGDTAYRLMHPKYECEKEYRLIARGEVDSETLKALRSPIEIDGKMTKGAKVKIIDYDNEKTELLVTISEGRNRQIRRICENAGVDIYRLIRVSVAGIYLKGLKRGAWRHLTKEEVGIITGKSKDRKENINDIYKKNNGGKTGRLL